MLRRTELASTVEEIQAILGQSPSNLKVRYLAEEKWREISRRNIEAAQTLCEALEAFRSTPSVRTMQIAAIHSCFQFAEDTASAKRICLSTNATSECREIALQHWLRVAATPEELAEVLKHCFDHVDIRNEVLLKIIRQHELVPA